MNGFFTIGLSREADPVLIIPEGELEYAREKGRIKNIRTFGWGSVKDIDPLISIAGNLTRESSL